MVEQENGAEKKQDVSQKRRDIRLTLVQDVLREAFNRATSLGKLMVDPMDVLIFLTNDPEVVAQLISVGVNLEELDGEVKKWDDGTPQGPSSAEMVRSFGDAIDLGNRRSMMLDWSIAKALEIADTEGCFDVTPLHLLAGIVSGPSTGATVFRNLDLTGEQLAILSRTRKKSA